MTDNWRPEAEIMAEKAFSEKQQLVFRRWINRVLGLEARINELETESAAQKREIAALIASGRTVFPPAYTPPPTQHIGTDDPPPPPAKIWCCGGDMLHQEPVRHGFNTFPGYVDE